MDNSVMHGLVSRHLRAEGMGDVDGAVAVYTDDIEHDVVGFPGSPHYGKDAARGFYDELTANFRTEKPSSANHRAGSTGLLACEPKEPRR